eukprot:368951_1
MCGDLNQQLKNVSSLEGSSKEASKLPKFNAPEAGMNARDIADNMHTFRSRHARGAAIHASMCRAIFCDAWARILKASVVLFGDVWRLMEKSTTSSHGMSTADPLDQPETHSLKVARYAL